MTPTDLERLAACERQIHTLRLALVAAAVSLVVLGTMTLLGAGPRPAVAKDTSLRLRELVIVDDAGVERARLGGNLPDAVIEGKRVRRGAEAAGLLIYDATGQERGGYVTFGEPNGNALITLDTRRGQVAYLAADPQEGAVFKIWTGGHSVELRADSGGARLTTNRDGRIGVQVPPLSREEMDAICAGITSEVAGLQEKPPLEDLLKACMQHMPEAECRKCLGAR